MNRGGRPEEGTALQLVPGEEFEVGLDPRGGLLSQPQGGDEALILTNRRVVRIGRQAGQRTIAAAPLERVDAVEVRQAERSSHRLSWGMGLTIVGLALAVLIWTVLDVPLLALLVGGIIAVVGIWLLLSYLLVEEEGQLCFLVAGQRISVPLHSRQSADGAFQMVRRFFELAHRPEAATPGDRGRRDGDASLVQPREMPVGAPETAATAPTPAPESGTAAPSERAVLLSKLAEERERLVSLVQGAPEDVAGRMPWAGEWSIKQNLAHVAEEERAFVAQAARGVGGDSPEVGGQEADQRLAAQEAVNQLSLADLLGELARTREATLKAIEGIPDQPLLSFRVRHRSMGELTLLQLLRVIYRHDRLHAEQIEKALRALTPTP